MSNSHLLTIGFLITYDKYIIILLKCHAFFSKPDISHLRPFPGLCAAFLKCKKRTATAVRFDLLFVRSYRAALAFSTRAVKAAGSAIAISDSILRFSSMPAFFRPFMKRL